MSVIWRSRWERGGPDRTKCCSVRRWNCVSRLVKSAHRNVESIKAPMPIAPTAPRCVANARRIAGKQCRACKGVSSCDRRQAETLCRLGVVLAGLGKLFELHVPRSEERRVGKEGVSPG